MRQRQNSFKRADWALAILRAAMLLCALAFGARLNALQRDSALSQLIHEQWETDQGLPQNAVHCIAQDLDGFLWFGTENGLVRFDGVKFEVFTEISAPRVPHNFVSSLLVARDGAIWAGTRTGGLCVYRDGVFEIPFEELVTAKVYSLSQSADGTIWVATDTGLIILRDEGIHRFTTADGLPEDQLTAVQAGSGGEVWIGTQAGKIVRFDGRQFKIYPTGHLRHSSSVKAIVAGEGEDQIWVAYDSAGLFQVLGDEVRELPLFPERHAYYIQTLYMDSAGAIWVGTQHDGMLRLFGGKASRFEGAEGLPDNDVLSIMRDREGSIWIGTHFGGLNRLREGKVVTSTMREGLPRDAVSCVVRGEGDVLWLGTLGGGLVKYENRSFTPIPLGSNAGVRHLTIRSLMRDREGKIWFGMDGAGVGIHEPGGAVTFLTREDGLRDEYVTALIQKNDGEIWLGTSKGGVHRYNPATRGIEPIEAPEFMQRYTRSFAEDRSGRLWIGTQGGLALYENGTFSLLHFESTPELSVRTLMADADGALWIGSRDDGLLLWREGEVFKFDGRTGLMHQRIYQILRSGNDLWLAGNIGIERVAITSLEEVRSGRAMQFRTQLFTAREGLRSSECGGDSTPSAAVTAGGRLAFGTLGGLAMIDPGSSNSVGVPPNVLITGIAVDNRQIQPARFGGLPPGATRLQIDYTALALRNPANVFFQYKMHDVDPDWVDAGRIREAVYYNLRPGSYQFQVKACNDEGVWNDVGAMLAFTVAPQFYQTGWFYLVSTAGALSTLFGAYRWRVRSIRRRNQDLARLVAERTHELEAEVHQRKQAEFQLRDLNEDLENRVKARTTELRGAYEHLQVELHERQEAEQALARSEARLRRIVDSGMVGILFWSKDGRISEANATFLGMVGYSREELDEGLVSWEQLTPPEYLKLDAIALEEIHRTGVCAPFEKEYIRKDGTRLHIMIGGASLSAEGDRGVCFVLDISKTKATEEEIRRLNHSLEARVHDRTLQLARINEQLAAEVQERKRVAVALSAFSQLGQKLHSARTEKEAAAIIAQSAWSLIPHDACSIDLYGPDDQLYPVFMLPEPGSTAGEPILRASISVPIRNGTRVVGVVELKSATLDHFTGTDASTLQALGDYCGGALERIHAEEARRETERRFATFMENAPALAWMKDSGFRYVFTNAVFQQFIGRSGDDLEGKTDDDLWPEAVAARRRADDLQSARQQSKLETEERIKRFDGETRVLLTLRFPFTTADGARFVAGMAIDVTEQKNAEEALHRLPQSILDAQETERRRVARELHDGVNQAIASIKFRLQTAEQQILRADPRWQETCGKTKEMLDSVLQQVRRLSRNLRPGELDDFGLVAAARSACQDFEARTGILVRFSHPELEERLPAPIELSLYRIIQEALTNAERHSGASAVEIELAVAGDHATLEVIDDGNGFELEPVAESRRGLGLLHMRERASLAGGTFAIKSAPGEGVRLQVDVPIRPESNPS